MGDIVQETAGVCGGYPCVADTRIPVRCLVLAYRELGDINAVAGIFSTLTRQEIRGALDWYIRHPERVEEDIRRNAPPATPAADAGGPPATTGEDGPYSGP